MVTLEARVRRRLGGFNLDVGFEAPEGITALFGPSGSGKTQTLRCIAGLVRPDSGRVALHGRHDRPQPGTPDGEGLAREREVQDGRVLFDSAWGVDIPARDRRVGYVFQHYALFPHLDVAGNASYGLHSWPRDRRRQRVEELLDLVGLTGYERRHPRELSGGEQQRVALARALAPQPELLLLDEPFSAIDALARAQLRRELRVVYERTGVPMLLVTHDLLDARELASFLVLYEDGKVLQTGPLPEVLSAPGSERVAELLRAAGA